MVCRDFGIYFHQVGHSKSLAAIKFLKEEKGFEVTAFTGAEYAEMEKVAYTVYDRYAAKDPPTAKFVALMKELKSLR